MANSYTAIPNIVPGNLTVNGKLTVNGGQIAMGKFQRQYRIQEIANGQFAETVNLDRVAGTQDDATSVSQVRTVQPAAAPFNLATQAAGVPLTDNNLILLTATELQVLLASLRVGAATPYMRLYNQPATGAWWSVNQQSDGVTRDDITKFGERMGCNLTINNFTTTTTDTSGNGVNADLRRLFWVDHSTHHNTGSTGLITVATRVVFGNQLGAFGGVYLLIMGGVNTGVGGASNLAVTLGAQNFPILTFPASTAQSFLTEVYIRNTGLTNTQNTNARTQYGLITNSIVAIGSALDTTVNQTLGINIQNTLTTDIIDIYLIEAEFISRTMAL